MKVEIHSLTNDPNSAWEEIANKQNIIKLNVTLPDNIPQNYARVVCMSDTHSLTSKINFDIPYGDIFIHAGDFTMIGSLQEVREFNEWIGKLPHKHKLLIAGNHELSFHSNYEEIFGPDVNPRELLTNCTYLEDFMIKIYGLKIYGTPWQPEHRDGAFNLPRGEPLLEKWNLIPNKIDILITHTPPLGIGDLCQSGARVGCVELLNTVQKRVRPRYHLFGHIHEGYGIMTDGLTTFINSSTCDPDYKPTNLPIVFDIPLPKGVIKD